MKMKHPPGQSNLEYLLIVMAILISLNVLSIFDGQALQSFSTRVEETSWLLNLPF